MALEPRLNKRTLEKGALIAFFRKYRYPLWIAALGVVLLLLPLEKDQTVFVSAEPVLPSAEAKDDTEERLEDILQCVSGAGQVRVMLTWKDEGETAYQSDSETVESTDSTNTRSQTVFRSDGGYQQTPLVTKVTAPECRGALVVCSGGEDPEVKLRIVKAVCSLTGLGSDRVTVLKMEGL